MSIFETVSKIRYVVNIQRFTSEKIF